MTEHAAKIIRDFRALSLEEKEEVFLAIASEPQTPEHREALEGQPFHVKNEAELKAAVQLGIDQADRGDTAPLDLKSIRDRAHARLAQTRRHV